MGSQSPCGGKRWVLWGVLGGMQAGRQAGNMHAGNVHAGGQVTSKAPPLMGGAGKHG